MRIRMHADEVLTEPSLVRRLLQAQMPHWAGLPLAAVSSYGTDHDIYRLGDSLSVRLPRIRAATHQAELEAVWLPRLSPLLPLALPVQVAIGEPGEGYPYSWSVYEWLPGETADRSTIDLTQAAVDLAAFIRALQRVDTAGACPRAGGRGGPLAHSDQRMRDTIHRLSGEIDAAATLRCWEESMAAPVWRGDLVWVHGDLLPGNVLVVDGRLSAVIDFGCLNIGDPACDLIPAWGLFDSDSRARFRKEMAVDDAAWLRGRGWALQIIGALTYYRDTNPGMIRLANRILSQVLAESCV